jgi:multiple sugar transport system permease protein
LTLSATKRLKALFIWVTIIIILVAFLFPIYWMVLSSLKTQIENLSYPPSFFFEPTTKNYEVIFVRENYLKYIQNSVIVALGSVIFSLLLGIPAAYSIVHFNQRRVALFLLLGRILPGVSVLIPWFVVYARLKLIDTYIGVIMAHMIQVFPLVTWLMITYFSEIPSSLHDQGMIDGCSIYGILQKIILPLSTPGLATAAILAFIFSWNNFMFSLVFAQSQTMTLPIAAYKFIGYGEIDWGGITAAATVITLPVMVLGLVIQRWVVQGLTLGALKG